MSNQYAVEKTLLPPSRYVPPALPDIRDVYLSQNYWRQLRGYPDPAFSGANFEDLVPPDLTGPGDIPTWDGTGWVPIPGGDPGQVISTPCEVFVEVQRSGGNSAHNGAPNPVSCPWTLVAQGDSDWLRFPPPNPDNGETLYVPAGQAGTYRVQAAGAIFQASGIGSGGGTNFDVYVLHDDGVTETIIASQTLFVADNGTVDFDIPPSSNFTVAEDDQIKLQVLSHTSSRVGFASATRTCLLQVMCAS